MSLTLAEQREILLSIQETVAAAIVTLSEIKEICSKPCFKSSKSSTNSDVVDTSSEPEDDSSVVEEENVSKGSSIDDTSIIIDEDPEADLKHSESLIESHWNRIVHTHQVFVKMPKIKLTSIRHWSKMLNDWRNPEGIPFGRVLNLHGWPPPGVEEAGEGISVFGGNINGPTYGSMFTSKSPNYRIPVVIPSSSEDGTCLFLYKLSMLSSRVELSTIVNSYTFLEKPIFKSDFPVLLLHKPIERFGDSVVPSLYLHYTLHSGASLISMCSGSLLETTLPEFIMIGKLAKSLLVYGTSKTSTASSDLAFNVSSGNTIFMPTEYLNCLEFQTARDIVLGVRIHCQKWTFTISTLHKEMESSQVATLHLIYGEGNANLITQKNMCGESYFWVIAHVSWSNSFLSCNKGIKFLLGLFLSHLNCFSVAAALSYHLSMTVGCLQWMELHSGSGLKSGKFALTNLYSHLQKNVYQVDIIVVCNDSLGRCYVPGFRLSVPGFDLDFFYILAISDIRSEYQKYGHGKYERCTTLSEKCSYYRYAPQDLFLTQQADWSELHCKTIFAAIPWKLSDQQVNTVEVFHVKQLNTMRTLTKVGSSQNGCWTYSIKCCRSAPATQVWNVIYGGRATTVTYLSILGIMLFDPGSNATEFMDLGPQNVSPCFMPSKCLSYNPSPFFQLGTFGCHGSTRICRNFLSIHVNNRRHSILRLLSCKCWNLPCPFHFQRSSSIGDEYIWYIVAKEIDCSVLVTCSKVELHGWPPPFSSFYNDSQACWSYMMLHLQECTTRQLLLHVIVDNVYYYKSVLEFLLTRTITALSHSSRYVSWLPYVRSFSKELDTDTVLKKYISSVLAIWDSLSGLHFHQASKVNNSTENSNGRDSEQDSDLLTRNYQSQPDICCNRTQYAVAKDRFGTTAVSDSASSDNSSGSTKVRNSCDFVESRKMSTCRGGIGSDTSDERSWSSYSSVVSRPLKCNDTRWDSIQAVRSREGMLGRNHVRLLKRLGCGDIGSVYVSELRRTRTYFTVKVMVKIALSSRKAFPRAQTESNISQCLDHLFLPTLYSHFETKRFSCLVMEFCPGGDLHTLRQRHPSMHFSENTARFYVAEFLLAMGYLHMLQIIYSARKPENVLVREDGQVTLLDFALSLRCVVYSTLIKSSNPDMGLSKNSSNCIQPAGIEPSCLIHPSCLQQTCFASRFFSSKGDYHTTRIAYIANKFWKYLFSGWYFLQQLVLCLPSIPLSGICDLRTSLFPRGKDCHSVTLFI